MIYYKDGAKRMRPVLSRPEYLALRNSGEQIANVAAAREGDGVAKRRLVQMNYSCLPNPDGSLKGSTRMSSTVGMDIDHIFGKDGKYDVVQGENMAPVTPKDLKTFVAAAAIPFVVKGVLSVRDAVQCAEAGVKGMVISHHSGRMPYAIPPLAVMPEIRKAVGTDIKLFVDCSIQSGADVFKALAMGADGVSIGRAMFQSLMDEGTEGVIRYFTEVNQELSMIMGFTGAGNLSEIDPSALWLRQSITQYKG